MRLERVKRWQWVVLSLVVGVALAYARRADPEALIARLGEGIADQRWFEQEVARKVPLTDGSALRAFDRLTVYPMTLHDRAGRRRVQVVAGMHLNEGVAGAAPQTGRLRPYFFIAPVPFQPLAGRNAASPGSFVTDYLDRLKGDGVTYAYAWWADARVAATAWVGGSFVLIGLLWPTFVNLVAFGSFQAPREERAASLWHVKPVRSAPARPQPVPVPAPQTVPERTQGDEPAPVTEPRADTATPTKPVALSVAPVSTIVHSGDPAHKEFAAKRDDFYPTELKAAHH